MLCLLALGAAASEPQTNKVVKLTLEDAIRLTLQHNLSIQIQRYNPIVDRYALAADYGVYEPSFFSTAGESYTASPGRDFNGLTEPPLDTKVQSYSGGIGNGSGGNAITPWGLQYNLSTTLNRNYYQTFTTNLTPRPPFNQDTAFTGLTLQQPLLRNLWIDSARATILIAKKNLRYDQLGFQFLVMTNVSATEQAYYELNYAFENVAVQQEAVTLAAQLVDENQKRVKAGVLTALDVAQSLSQLASAKASLLAARQLVVTDENNLKNLITDRYRDLYDTKIEPVEKLVAIPTAFDLSASWQAGLSHRPDVLQAKVNIDRQAVNKRYQFNQIFPQLDLTGSYGRTGLAETAGDAYGQIPPNKFPSYSYGIVFSTPLGDTTPRNNYKSAKATWQQAQLIYRQVEQTTLIQIENEIEVAKSDFEQVTATREARSYAEEALTDEQRKLEVGTSTPFIVLQLQSNLTTARSAEIRALADYNEALTALAFFEGATLERRHLKVAE